MSNKKVLSSLDFERKARLVAPVVSTEARSGITVAPDGSLIYDATMNSNPMLAQGFYGRIGDNFRKLLTSADISTDTNFNNEGGLLANRDTIRQYVESMLTTVGGSFKGAWDPTGGIVPNSPNIKAGDSWRVSVAAEIPGLPGGVTSVEVGDLLIASVDDPANASQFFVLQTNIADASNVLLGGASPTTPLTGDLQGTDSVQAAIRKLFNKIQNSSENIDWELLAGRGIVWDISGGAHRFNVDIATNGGLEFEGGTGPTAQLRLKGLADYSAVAAANRVALGVDANGNLVVDKSLFAQNLSGAFSALAGKALTYNPITQKIDLGGSFDSSIFIQSYDGSSFQISSLIPTVVTTQLQLNPNFIQLYSIMGESPYTRTEIKLYNDGIYVDSTHEDYQLPGTGVKNVVVAADGKLRFEDFNSPTKFSATITGNGSAASFTVTHNKDSKDVIVQVFDVATDDEVEVTISRTTVNAVDIIFAVAPPSGQAFRVVVI
ncbi:hypothetical protein [Rhodoflexus caldus]|uniref:hypothetical protein n=1 Tax=Rhodoflexus caldus TaxID=2891236 RepID=UPI00202A1DC7|nr:hypothetical protein [Rhodoflexus caldus]